jgi:Glycosyl transferases group 1
VKVALLTTALFDSPANGGERCTQRLVSALHALGHTVHLAGCSLGRPADCQSSLSLGCGELPFESLPSTTRLAMLAAATWRGEAVGLSRRRRRGISASANDWLAELRPDRLIVDHLQALAWLPDARPDLLLMHNHESAVYRDQAASEGGLRAVVLAREARLIEQYESKALPSCRALAYLSDSDHKALNDQLGPSAPPGDTLPSFCKPVAIPRRASSGKRRVGAIGSWTWGPNRVALQWLLDEVYPRLRHGVELVLAGYGLEQIKLPNGVVRLGRVNSPADFYAEVDAVLVPAVHGSGVQEKAVEAIASARCVIATPHALRGMGPDLPGHVHAAADALEFSEVCIDAPIPEAATALAESSRWACAREQLYFERLAHLLSVEGSSASRLN